ncbi:MAG: crosslink repair DNA glycosylase YcaQ family protein [Pseudomonadales bacterium]
MTIEQTSISKRDARRIFLSRQGLLTNNSFGRGKNAVKKAIDKLSWLQIDTISVVERAHHHIIRSRVSNYDPEMLHQLQSGERHLFEYWSHAAAYLPIKDYRYYLPVMEGSARKRKPDKKLAPEILKRIRNEGPLQSRDFEGPKQTGSAGWWNWKPAKRVLEQLFLCGELMITHRDGFQKVYDLRENVLPSHINTSTPTEIEWCEFIIDRMIGALGVATEYDVGYSRTAIRQLTDKKIKPRLEEALQNLLESNRIIALNVEGLSCYTHTDTLSELPLRLGKRHFKLLSPFDNLIINRRRTLELFQFDYQLECYVPAPKRRFGYFCLPILYGDKIIGRIDAKAVRKVADLEIRNLVMDEHVKLTDQLISALKNGLISFAEDNKCTSISTLKTTPTSLKHQLKGLL